MKKRLSVLITVLVCAVSTFLFFLVPQEAQIVESGPGYDGAVQPEGGLLYYVNTTSDTIVVNACANGVAGCSLRGAIQVANTHAGIDGIEFDLPPNSVINLTQALPDVTGSVGISQLIPANDIAFPQGATHASLRSAWAKVDFETKEFEAVTSNVFNVPLNKF